MTISRDLLLAGLILASLTLPALAWPHDTTNAASDC
jgi:hypothetical protein